MIFLDKLQSLTYMNILCKKFKLWLSSHETPAQLRFLGLPSYWPSLGTAKKSTKKGKQVNRKSKPDKAECSSNSKMTSPTGLNTKIRGENN